jgi:predicted CopG family antitoxin
MVRTIELDDELYERLESHTEDDETVEELIEELVSVYETEGAFLQEGYSE